MERYCCLEYVYTKKWVLTTLVNTSFWRGRADYYFIIEKVTYIYLESAWKMLQNDPNKPVFGPVVLEIACSIFISKTSCCH